MTRPATPMLRLLAAGVLLAGLGACEQQEADPDAQGPAERAGAQLDQALTRAGDELNKMAEKTGEQLQVFGRRLQDEAQEAQREREAQQAAANEEGVAATSGE